MDSTEYRITFTFLAILVAGIATFLGLIWLTEKMFIAFLAMTLLGAYSGYLFATLNQARRQSDEPDCRPS